MNGGDGAESSFHSISFEHAGKSPLGEANTLGFSFSAALISICHAILSAIFHKFFRQNESPCISMRGMFFQIFKKLLDQAFSAGEMLQTSTGQVGKHA